MKRARRVYEALLHLLPAEFRERYGRAMADFHEDRLDAAARAGRSRTLIWARALADIVASSAREHVDAITPEKPTMRSLAADLSFAVRSLVRRPAFAAIVILTIALGVGVNAAIFSVVSGVLIRPLPYPHAERVFGFGHEPPTWLASEPDFMDYKLSMRTIDGLAAYTMNEVTLATPDDPERIRLVRASEDFFGVMGVRPLLGRTFASDEYQRNVPVPVIVSYGLWQRRFGGRGSVIGATIPINGTPRTIVGVMPPHFDFPESRTDIWIPLPRFRADSGDRTNHYLFMVGRLKPGVTLERALSEATSVAKRIMRDEPEHFDPAVPLRPHMERVQDHLVGSTEPYLLALLGAVGFVLLIACANVANLLLVRAESRRRELALRGALGASVSRLGAFMLAESLLLAVVGGVLGLALAVAVQRLLLASAPASVPRLDAIAIDWRVLLFTIAITAATALLIGMVPAWRSVRENAADVLRAGGRSATQHRRGARARRTLVAAEVALAVVTIAGAGLLLRSLWNLERNPLGFEPHDVLTAKVAISARDYDDTKASIYFNELLARVRALPNVRAAGASQFLPVVDAGGLWGFQIEGRDYGVERWPTAVRQQTTPGFFRSAGIPLIAGREIMDTDREGSEPVAVVSEKLAALDFPGESALGKRLRLGETNRYLRIVGIVGDISSRGYGDAPEPTIYLPYDQAARSASYSARSMAILVRSDGNPAAQAKALVAIAHALDPRAPVSDLRTLDAVVGTSVANRRFTTVLLAGFAILALVLAGLGIYGVTSYGVAQRTSEIGIRIALGAEQGSVMRLVVGEALRMCAAGTIVGIAGAVLVARLARGMLVGVTPGDPVSLGVACVAHGLIGAAAAALPARRAMRVSPTEALAG
jgi:predicted permease